MVIPDGIRLDDPEVGQHVGYIVDLDTVSLDDNNESWIHILPVGKYQHPKYGEIDITPERVRRFATNVNRKIRGQDLDIDYDHKKRTDEAAGWIKSADVRSNGLWALVEFTKAAAQKIRDKAYRYFSPEFADKWQDNQGQAHQDVLFGGGLTNRPFLKDILPLNLSEYGGDMNPFLKALAQKLGLTVEDGKQLSEDEVLTKLRSHLSLAEDASEDDIAAAMLADPSKAKPDPNKLSEENEAALKALLGEDSSGGSGGIPLALKPVITKMFNDYQTQAKRLEQLEAANEMAEIDMAIQVLSEGDHVVPPKLHDDLKILLSEVGAENRNLVIGFLKKLTSDGLPDMRTHGRTRGKSADGKNVSQIIHEKATALVTQNQGMSFTEAMQQVAQQEPQLYNEYRQNTYRTGNEGANV
jgi:hypothetical protein